MRMISHKKKLQLNHKGFIKNTKQIPYDLIVIFFCEISFLFNYNLSKFFLILFLVIPIK
jgi:hypothetical protein